MLARKLIADSEDSDIDSDTDSVTNQDRPGQIGSITDNTRNAEHGLDTGKLQKHVSAKF